MPNHVPGGALHRLCMCLPGTMTLHKNTHSVSIGTKQDPAHTFDQMPSAPMRRSPSNRRPSLQSAHTRLTPISSTCNATRDKCLLRHAILRLEHLPRNNYTCSAPLIYASVRPHSARASHLLHLFTGHSSLHLPDADSRSGNTYWPQTCKELRNHTYFLCSTTCAHLLSARSSTRAGTTLIADDSATPRIVRS